MKKKINETALNISIAVLYRNGLSLTDIAKTLDVTKHNVIASEAWKNRKSKVGRLTFNEVRMLRKLKMPNNLIAKVSGKTESAISHAVRRNKLDD